MDLINALLKWGMLLGLVAVACWACVSAGRRIFRIESRKPRKSREDRRKASKRVHRDRRQEPRRKEDVAREFVDDLEKR